MTPPGRLALWREAAGMAAEDRPTARERALEAAVEGI
jgi:hypothetical protein